MGAVVLLRTHFSAQTRFALADIIYHSSLANIHPLFYKPATKHENSISNRLDDSYPR